MVAYLNFVLWLYLNSKHIIFRRPNYTGAWQKCWDCVASINESPVDLRTKSISDVDNISEHVMRLYMGSVRTTNGPVTDCLCVSRDQESRDRKPEPARVSQSNSPTLRIVGDAIYSLFKPSHRRRTVCIEFATTSSRWLPTDLVEK